MKSEKEKLIDSIKLYIRKNEFDNDTFIYSIEEWKERGEDYLNDSEFVITSEGGLSFILNFGPDEDFYDLIDSFGYYFEMGHSWSYGFYKDEGSTNKLPLNKKLSYSEKLRDDRWKSKSLRKKEWAEFECQDCGNKNNLEIHHCYYKYGLEPWQYPLDSLRCLCSICHKKRGALEMEFRAKLAEITTTDLEAMTNLVTNGILSYPKQNVMNLISSISDSKEEMIKRFEELIKSKE
jgi:hypothetical protein